MMSEIKLLAHRKDFFFIPPEAREMRQGRSAFCGDLCRLFMYQEEEDLCYAYSGEGCMLMCASAHLLCKRLKGSKYEEALAIIDRGLCFFYNADDEDEELAIFRSAINTLRRECLLLPWKVAKTFFLST